MFGCNDVKKDGHCNAKTRMETTLKNKKFSINNHNLTCLLTIASVVTDATIVLICLPTNRKDVDPKGQTLRINHDGSKCECRLGIKLPNNENVITLCEYLDNHKQTKFALLVKKWPIKEAVVEKAEIQTPNEPAIVAAMPLAFSVTQDDETLIQKQTNKSTKKKKGEKKPSNASDHCLRARRVKLSKVKTCHRPS